MSLVEIALVTNLLGTLSGSIAYCVIQNRKIARAGLQHPSGL